MFVRILMIACGPVMFVSSVALGQDIDATKADHARAQAAIQGSVEEAASDPTRPVYHFRPPAQWMNDICGAIYHKGYYHIFYQLNPYGDGWGADGSAWGHARSRDLVKWEHLPIALLPRTRSGVRRCNSGCVTRDAGGRVMIFYTVVPKKGKRSQWAAVAEDDELRSWRRVAGPLMSVGAAGVPKNTNGGWSDPFVFKSDGRTFVTFKSCGGLVCEAQDKALTKWKYVGRMDGVSGECPNFFKLGDKWVLLRSTYPPSYRIGQFHADKIAFTAEAGKGGTVDYVYGPKRPGSWSRGFYGTNVMFDDKGRCVLLAWVSGFKPKRGWNGCMSLPRIITLDKNARLIQKPAPELKNLRGEAVAVKKMTVSDASKFISGAGGDTIEIVAELQAGDAKAFGLKLRSSDDGKNALVIRQDAAKLNVAGTDVPVALGKTLKLHIFLDRSVMEVFVNDGTHTVTRVVYPGEKDLKVAIFAEGGAAAIEAMTVWQMKRIWAR